MYDKQPSKPMWRLIQRLDFICRRIYQVGTFGLFAFVTAPVSSRVAVEKKKEDMFRQRYPLLVDLLVIS